MLLIYLVELLHAPDVARGEAIDVGFFLLDIVSELLDCAFAPLRAGDLG